MLCWRFSAPRLRTGLTCCRCTLLQVNNAATKGASAVLIYPDNEDFNYGTETDLYGHVSSHARGLLYDAKVTIKSQFVHLVLPDVLSRVLILYVSI